MSNTESEGADDEVQELDFAALREREQAKREATKEFVVEYDDGAVARWKYRMVEDIEAIADEHTRRKPTRSGQEDDVEVTDKYAFSRDVLKAGLVDAPDGFEVTKRALQEDITDELMNDLVDAITEFSTMDEVTRRQFRGVCVRE
jgi:hypothetical protein